jgi:hypothetical protein
MSEGASDVAMAIVLERLNDFGDQLKAITEATTRIETAQLDMLERLDRIEADRAKLELVARVAALAHAAAMGNRAPLPVDAVDDPLLERFALTQPADHVSTERALVDWRDAAQEAGTAQLMELLKIQYRPSPTDTAETRVLRYRLAAITRSEIEGRGVTPPPAPTTTRAQDRSALASRTQDTMLAGVWRRGSHEARFADPELAGALDVFLAAQKRPDLTQEESGALFHGLADLIESGQRPSSATVKLRDRTAVQERDGPSGMER